MVPGAVKLENKLDTVSSHRPVPPNPQHINIIIEPPSGKRCVHRVSEILLMHPDRPQPLFPFLQTDFIRLRRGFREAKNEDEEHDLRWLKELHKKNLESC